MVQVRIISGGYGQRINGRIRLQSRGSIVEVDNAEAERLIAMGSAEYVAEIPDEQEICVPKEAVPTPELKKPEPKVEKKPLYDDDYDEKTVAQLKAIATMKGVPITGLSRKADIIEAIRNYEGPVISAGGFR